MTQEERLNFLIDALLVERQERGTRSIPAAVAEKKRLLRALMNVRPPLPAEKRFLDVQDAYLRQECAHKGVTDAASLTPVCENLCLWQGDITTLKADAVVNAANSGLLGCFVPCHGCIDNAIHTYAGVQLRLACAALMERQGAPEKTGSAKITPAWSLPSRYVLHTVGPIIAGEATRQDCEQLASCYRACLQLAKEQGLKSIAFCCISTGEFRFPRELAANIAVETVRACLAEMDGIRVIFNVFKEEDRKIYQRVLQQ